MSSLYPTSIKKIPVSVLGANGYAGAQLVALIDRHPAFELVGASGGSTAGGTLADLYPAARTLGLEYAIEPLEEVATRDAELVFTALPHTTCLELVPRLVGSGKRIIDLSADFRFADTALYERAYGLPHPASNLSQQAIYGLTEFVSDKLSGSNLVSNPGCYPTVTLLGLLPVLKAGIAPSSIHVSALSGMSGAGRTPSPAKLFCSADETVTAYKPLTHQHAPEIEAFASRITGNPVAVDFVPHTGPFKRGILADIFLSYEGSTSAAETALHEEALAQLFHDAFDEAPFVQVLAPGAMPSIAAVAGTNSVQIGFAMRPETQTVYVSVAIDNLLKGAAGQAVQNANVCYGLPQELGLTTIATLF